MPEFTGHRDLRSYLRVLWRWKYVFVAILIAAPVVTYFLERGKPKIYRSSAIVGVSQESVNSSLLTGSASFTTTNIDAIARLVTTTQIANIAGAFMKPTVPGSSIVGDVSATPNSTTDFITITATTQSPQRSAEIANAFSKALLNNQQSQAVSQIKSSIAGLKTELSHLSKTNAQRPQLEQQLAQLESSIANQSGQGSIIEAATPNLTPIGPHLRRTVELGFIIGLLLAVAVVVLADSADRRMRSPDDLESLTDLTLLAAIPPSAFTDDLLSKPEDEETFQMLRTSITYFTGAGGQRLSSVMVTSPGEKEGKSTVAAKLALASARAGLDVVLVDADLRRGGASTLFGLRAQPGLGAALESRSSGDTTLVEWPLGEYDAGRLRVLPSGPPPANPAALMSSDQIRTIIASLQTQSDLVIVDTPAALAVSDAVPLMHVVGGIVLVARMNHSSRETINRLQKIIESAHGHLLGVVATGVTSTPGYEKYSQSYYAPASLEPSTKGRRRRRGTPPPPPQPAGGVRLVPPSDPAAGPLDAATAAATVELPSDPAAGPLDAATAAATVELPSTPPSNGNGSGPKA